MAALRNCRSRRAFGTMSASTAALARSRANSECRSHAPPRRLPAKPVKKRWNGVAIFRSEEHTSELQSLMRISYAVFCLKKKKKQNEITSNKEHTQKYDHKRQ